MASINYTKTPETLYEQCINKYVANLNYTVTMLDSVQKLRYLPPEVLIDIYVRMADREEVKDMLLEQLSDLNIFERVLRFDPARQKLFHCLSALMSSNKLLADNLQRNYRTHYQRKTKYSRNTEDTITSNVSIENNCTKVDTAQECDNSTDDVPNIIEQADDLEAWNLSETHFGIEAIDFGLRLGSFLSEAGWQAESIQVLQSVAARLRDIKEMDNEMRVLRLDCLQRLLHSEAALFNFKSARRTYAEIVDLLKEIKIESIPNSLLANTYTQFSAMYFARSEYDDSHMWSVVAMRHLEENTPERIAIDVLRQAAKACVVKRDFHRANMLISQATHRAGKIFGSKHQKYADALLDYGFFLLNVDSVYQSVKVYKTALDIKRFIFGSRNFHVAIAHEDLSYAYYVHEYSTGNFTCSREHVEKAVDIMKDLVPSDHLMLASAKRVKALLLEEIALDKMAEGIDEDGLLQQSEELHKFALQLSLEVFGEMNVQTAKHYGNLGRLYQTMSRYQEAESMHQKAIKIKTDLLGQYDYEVGLSIGHLASLYNYQMKKYREAEDLYLRSIEISLRLFGHSYSGLEYDYLGLCHVYETLREFEKYLKYATILENWQTLRGQNPILNKSNYPAIDNDCSLEEVKKEFFNLMCP
ncbi:amyloid protein-binding protein 2 [Teleopsis dalmanni]|uniref:amyloid protein-binding protein 2 n=1 Tax=Teleopsis dalmanni TaxID=139649 RepID=UPI0018CE5793|nr:amyloid protein-binding protein 2 [Teleopsis dalmanni]